MSMSKKDFIALADRIKAGGDLQGPLHFTQHQIDFIADFCTGQNPRFNRQRWLDYIAGKCGANGGKVKP